MPWLAADVVAGFVARSEVPWLLAHSDDFRPDGDRLRLAGADFATRSQAVADVTRRLAAKGRIRSLTGEHYAVVQRFGDAPLLQVDRAAVQWLGVRPFGVHLNGFVRTTNGLAMWIAQRSLVKPTWPGRLDNLVAGGQPIGLSLHDNLRKECGEEAGIPADLASRAVPVSTITYVTADPNGLKPDTLFCYDLELPPDFVPTPVDGEVERFFLLGIDEVKAIVRDSTRFKPNCSLVVLDFLLRHGLLDGELDAGERAALARQLRRPLP